MLFDPAKFEPLTDRAWDEAWVRERIREIVADADDAVRRGRRSGRPTSGTPGRRRRRSRRSTSVPPASCGRSTRWRRRGHAEPRLDLAAAARRTLESWREEPDMMRGHRAAGPGPGRAPLRSERHPRRRVAARLRRATRRRAARARAREHRQRRRRGHVGLARDDARGPGDARLDGRGALGGGVADERREAARAPGRGRPLGEATLRRHLPRARPAARRRRQRARAARRPRPARRPRRETTLERDTAAVLAPDGCRRGRSRQLAQLGRPGLEWEGEIRLQWCCGTPGIVASAASYLDEDLLLAGRGDDLAGGRARAGQRRRHLPRHRRQRLRVAEDRSSERGTSSGSTGPGGSRSTRSSRRGRPAPSRDTGATRSGRATPASPSTRPTASTCARGTRSWRPGTRPRTARRRPGRSAAQAPRRQGRRGS